MFLAWEQKDQWMQYKHQSLVRLESFVEAISTVIINNKIVFSR